MVSIIVNFSSVSVKDHDLCLNGNFTQTKPKNPKKSIFIESKSVQLNVELSKVKLDLVWIGLFWFALAWLG
jgi:hypothetical protein